MKFTSSGPWAVFRQLQELSSFPIVNPRSFGFDETMNVLLDAIERGESANVQAIKNLCANRAGKERHRRRLAVADTIHDERAPSLVDAIHAKRALVFVENVIGVADFAVLQRVAETSYEDVAIASGVSVGTLKARVARLRARVRAAWIDRFGSDLGFYAEVA